MIGVGPFIAHSETPIFNSHDNMECQVPNTELMTYKIIALARIACPQANIPSTTALATLNKDNGREKGLIRGSNVVMPNLTPLEYRKYYEIYPAKVCINESAHDCRSCMKGRIFSIGRETGKGPGNRISAKQQ
jgi:biotin synthase